MPLPLPEVSILTNIRDHERRLRTLETANRTRTAVSGIVGSGTAWVADEFFISTTGDSQTFTLSYAPVLNSDLVFLNGLMLSQNSEYTLTGTSLFLVITLTNGDDLTVRYQA